MSLLVRFWSYPLKYKGTYVRSALVLIDATAPLHSWNHLLGELASLHEQQSALDLSEHDAACSAVHTVRTLTKDVLPVIVMLSAETLDRIYQVARHTRILQTDWR